MHNITYLVVLTVKPILGVRLLFTRVRAYVTYWTGDTVTDSIHVTVVP